MTITIADLLIRLRADVSDAGQGIRSTQSDLQGVGRAADQTTASLRAQESAVERLSAAQQRQGAAAAAAQRQARAGALVNPSAPATFTPDREARYRELFGPVEGAAAPANPAQSAGERNAMLTALADVQKQRQRLLRSGFSAEDTDDLLAELDQSWPTGQRGVRRPAPPAAAVPRGNIDQALGGLGLDGKETDRIAAAQQRAQAATGLAERLRVAGVDAGVAARESKRIVDALEPGEQHARGLAESLHLSGTNALRVSAALAGVGLGINVAAGLAHQFHQLVLDAVGAEAKLEYAARATNAVYGQRGAGQLQGFARDFENNPTTRGNQVDAAQAALGMHQLTTEYGLNLEQVQALTTAAGQLAKIHNTDVKPAAEALVAVVKGSTQAAEEYGLSLVDEYGRLRSVGMSYDQLVAAVGPAQAASQLEADTLKAVADQSQNAAGRTDALADAMDRSARATDRNKEALGKLLAGAGGAVIDYLAGFRLIGDVQGAEQAAAARAKHLADLDFKEVLNPDSEIGQTVTIRASTGERVSDQEVAAAETEAAHRAQQAAEDARSAQIALGTSAEQAATSLRNQAQAVALLAVGIASDLTPALNQLAGTQKSIGALATVAGGLSGPDINRGVLLPGQTEQLAAAQAAQEVLQRKAREDLASSPDVQKAIDDARAINPDEFTRRSVAAQMQTQAGQAAFWAQRGQIEAQATLSAVQIHQDERRLSVATQQADLKREQLELERNMAGLLLEQANLQDRITVASRDNLDSRRALLAAQQAALPAQQTLARGDEQQQLKSLQIAAEIAARRQGRSLGVNIGQTVGSMVDFALNERPFEALASAQGQLAVNEVGRQRDAEQLAREQRVADLEDQDRKLRDQLIPLQEQQRLVEAKEQAIQRTLELLNLEDTQEITAAQHRLNESNQLKLDAEAAQRAAADYAAGLDRGATAAERAQTALEKARDAANQIGQIGAFGYGPDSARGTDLVAPDRQRTGPTPPAPTAGTWTVTFNNATVRSEEDLQRIRQIVNEEFTRIMQAGGTASQSTTVRSTGAGAY